MFADAAKLVLGMLGCSLLSSSVKGEGGRDIEGQSVAAAGIDIEPDDVLTLKVQSLVQKSVPVKVKQCFDLFRITAKVLINTI